MPKMSKLSSCKTAVITTATTGVVRYVDTNIVTWDADHVTLNTGGWRSATTKQKMNQAAWQFKLGYSVRQRQGLWFVSRWDASAMRWIDEQAFNGDTFVFSRHPKIF